MKSFTGVMLMGAALSHDHKWMTKHTEDQLVLKKARKVREPMVQQNGYVCLWENHDDSWCFSSTPPLIKVGWENEQAFYDYT